MTKLFAAIVATTALVSPALAQDKIEEFRIGVLGGENARFDSEEEALNVALVLSSVLFVATLPLWPLLLRPLLLRTQTTSARSKCCAARACRGERRAAYCWQQPLRRPGSTTRGSMRHCSSRRRRARVRGARAPGRARDDVAGRLRHGGRPHLPRRGRGRRPGAAGLRARRRAAGGVTVTATASSRPDAIAARIPSPPRFPRHRPGTR